MSYMKHHAIVVTGSQPAAVQAAHEEAARRFGPLVSSIAPVIVNAGGSFFIAPDGSKEDWPESDEHDAKRDAFLGWLAGLEAKQLYVK